MGSLLLLLPLLLVYPSWKVSPCPRELGVSPDCPVGDVGVRFSESCPCCLS